MLNEYYHEEQQEKICIYFFIYKNKYFYITLAESCDINVGGRFQNDNHLEIK